MEELAKKCIWDHRQPMIKVNLPGTKLFLEANDPEETKLINEYRERFEKALRHSRVDRRCGRARAAWLVDLQLARVNRIVKNVLKFWGFQNKDGVFLYPEEMLFLIETNRLEVQLNDIPLPIDHAFKIALESPDMNIMKYRVYKKLVCQGYKLLRFEEYANKKSKPVYSSKRRYTEEHSDPEKKPKLDDNTEENNIEQNRQEESNLALIKIQEIFEKLRDNMPVDFPPPDFVTNPDYYVFLPTNLHKNVPDFHLYICDGKIIDKIKVNSDFPNIFAVCLDDVSFYRMANVNIPFI